MLLRNDKDKNWVNGSIGTITKLSESDIIIDIDGHEYNVGRETWEMIDYEYNRETHKIESNTIGTFTQYPIIPAWAITIHKSQGKTFDQVNIDFGRGAFAHGQVYVALSRCTSLDGITLLTKVSHRDIIVDSLVLEFIQNVN